VFEGPAATSLGGEIGAGLVAGYRSAIAGGGVDPVEGYADSLGSVVRGAGVATANGAGAGVRGVVQSGSVLGAVSASAVTG
jgi:hypothetical protein